MNYVVFCMQQDRSPQVARTVAELPPGARITDYISLGVITRTFPLSIVGPVLANTGKASLRQRNLPAQAGCHDTSIAGIN
jgi:hypothetical protein